MIRGRYIFFLALAMSSTAYSQGFAANNQWYQQPQSNGYGMYGAQQGCGSAPRSVPSGIRNLIREGSKLEKDVSKGEREITKLTREIRDLKGQLRTAERESDSSVSGEDNRKSIRVFRATYTKDTEGCKAVDGKVKIPKGTKNSVFWANASQPCPDGEDCGSAKCHPVDTSDWCKGEGDCGTKKDGEVCKCEYDEEFACSVSGGGGRSSGCAGSLKKVRKLQDEIAKKEDELISANARQKELEADLEGVRSDYDERMSADEYSEDFGSEAGTCFSCLAKKGGGGGGRYESGGANGFNVAQTGIMAVMQGIGMYADYKNRGRMADYYSDLGYPPPPNAYAPFVVGGYGFPFMQGGMYGGVYGGVGGGGFGCAGSAGGGGYANGPYGMYSPYGMQNPYGYPPQGMWGMPGGGQMGPYGPYMPGMFPGGGQAGPWGMNAGFNAGFNLGGQFGMPGYGMPGGGQYGMPGYGMPGFEMPGGGQYGMPGFGGQFGGQFGMPGYGQPGYGGQFGMPGYGQPGYGGQFGMPGYGQPGYGGQFGMPGYGGQFGAGGQFGGQFGMPGYGMPGGGQFGMPGMPGYGMPGYGMPGGGQFGMPGMPGFGGGTDYSAYMRQVYSRYTDNYSSTLREYQNLSFDMQSMYQRLQMLQYQLSNPYALQTPIPPLAPTPVPTPTPTGTTPGR